jgi:hypothetical protein
VVKDSNFSLFSLCVRNEKLQNASISFAISVCPNVTTQELLKEYFISDFGELLKFSRHCSFG